MTRQLMEGSEAMAQAAVAAGCRFFAGYPMTPFTELLEHFAVKLPPEGGTCINAESELEAVGMTWGALATGARAATGSTGQGLALMQESFSEMTLAGLPLVIFNMSRGQSDYYQATRGGGHGDYRHIVLAPADSAEAVELTQLAFHLADQWRNPVLIYGDYLLAHTYEAVDVEKRSFPPLPEKDWAVDGSRNGSGNSRLLTPLGLGKHGHASPGPEAHWKSVAARHREIAKCEVRFHSEWTEDAELIVVAFGTPARFVRYAVRELREQGLKIGVFRPITLWPFPADALSAACHGARRAAVFEINAGQMIDDVRLSLEGRIPSVSIGGISTDSSGFGVGDLLNADTVRQRIEAAYRGEESFDA